MGQVPHPVGQGVSGRTHRTGLSPSLPLVYPGREAPERPFPGESRHKRS